MQFHCVQTYIIKHNTGHKGYFQCECFLAVGHQNIRSLSSVFAFLGGSYIEVQMFGTSINVVAVGAQHAVNKIEGLFQFKVLKNTGMQCVQLTLFFSMLTIHFHLSSGCVVVKLTKYMIRVDM